MCVCVLGKCDEAMTPSRERLDILMQAGLGKMKLTLLDKKANHMQV